METALAQVLWITSLIQLLRGLFVTGYPVPTKSGKKAEETNQQGCYKVQSEGYLGKEGITSQQLKERLKNRTPGHRILISLGSIPCLGQSQPLRLNRI